MLATLCLYQQILQNIYVYTHFFILYFTFFKELAVKYVNKKREHIDKLHCKKRNSENKEKEGRDESISDLFLGKWEWRI